MPINVNYCQLSSIIVIIVNYRQLLYSSPHTAEASKISAKRSGPSSNTGKDKILFWIFLPGFTQKGDFCTNIRSNCNHLMKNYEIHISNEYNKRKFSWNFFEGKSNMLNKWKPVLNLSNWESSNPEIFHLGVPEIHWLKN